MTYQTVTQFSDAESRTLITCHVAFQLVAVLGVALILLFAGGCTKSEVTVTKTVSLPVGYKLVAVEWKNVYPYYLTRPFQTGESVETYDLYNPTTKEVVHIQERGGELGSLGREYPVTGTVILEPTQKLVGIAWKDAYLQYVTRLPRDNEVAATFCLISDIDHSVTMIVELFSPHEITHEETEDPSAAVAAEPLTWGDPSTVPLLPLLGHRF